MSLAAAHESRKERLEALRRRKDGTETDGFIHLRLSITKTALSNSKLASKETIRV